MKTYRIHGTNVKLNGNWYYEGTVVALETPPPTEVAQFFEIVESAESKPEPEPETETKRRKS